jgi:hypothetical protein
MSVIISIEGSQDTVCCAADGCGNRFDPAREGFNGECDSCAALAADHFFGFHESLHMDCLFCWAGPSVGAGRELVAV